MWDWYDLAAAVMLPAAVTATVLLVGWRLGRRRFSARDSRTWAGPLAVGAGFASGYLALLGWPGFPPLDAVDWLLFLAPLLGVVGFADSFWRAPFQVQVLSVAVVVACGFLLLAWPVWSAPEQTVATSLLFAAAAVTALSIISIDMLAVRTSAARLGAVLLAVAVPASIVLFGSGSARLGMIGVMLAATQAGAIAAHIVLGRAGLGRGTVLVFGTLLGGLLLCGLLYGEVQPLDALLLAIAANLAWSGLALRNRLGWWGQTLVQFAAILAVAAWPAVRAWSEAAAAQW